LLEKANGSLLVATMEADPTKAYDQGDATGFIRLNVLRLPSGIAAKALYWGLRDLNKCLTELMDPAK